ncbi:MAG: GNAT family N-acetyltransferase [Flavobacteriaceae bacterium]
MIQIVKADVSHAKLLSTIGERTFLDAHSHSAPEADIKTYIAKTYAIETVVKELLQPENVYHILYYNNTLAGYSKIVCHSPNDHISSLNLTKLDRIYFLKEFHGLGLAKTLLNFNINLSKKHQQKGMWLAVWVDNFRAVNFYKKLGFTTVGEYHFRISKTHTNPNHVMYLEY